MTVDGAVPAVSEDVVAPGAAGQAGPGPVDRTGAFKEGAEPRVSLLSRDEPVEPPVTTLVKGGWGVFIGWRCKSRVFAYKRDINDLYRLPALASFQSPLVLRSDSVGSRPEEIGEVGPAEGERRLALPLRSWLHKSDPDEVGVARRDQRSELTVFRQKEAICPSAEGR